MALQLERVIIKDSFIINHIILLNLIKVVCMAASMDSTCETKTLLSDQFETNFCENIEWQAAGGMGNHLMYQ